MDRDVARRNDGGPRTDQGLAGLGLIMQLGGAIFLVHVAGQAARLIEEAHAPWGGLATSEFDQILVMAAASVARSALHIWAGRCLASGQSRRGLLASYLYIGAALAQTALTLVLIDSVRVSAPATLTIASFLLAWPLTLLVVVIGVHLRGARPVSVDPAVEGTGALGALLGLVGSLTAVFLLYTALQGKALPSSAAQQLLFAGVCALLMARSILLAVAGFKAAGDPGAAARATTRYITFGLASALLTGALVALYLLDRRASSAQSYFRGAWLAEVAKAIGMLLVLPLIQRRLHRGRTAPAAGGGVMAVGWLLLAVGLGELFVSVPRLLFGSYQLMESPVLWVQLNAWSLAASMGSFGMSWPQLATVAVQMWAAVELIRMTARRRLACAVYLGLSAAVMLYTIGATLEKLSFAIDQGIWGMESVATLFQIAFWLVAPMATMILVNRQPAASRDTAGCP